jgi:hypothetical protein
MFRVTLRPSSGETTVFMRHLVLVWMTAWYAGWNETECRTNTVVSPDDGRIVARNM